MKISHAIVLPGGLLERNIAETKISVKRKFKMENRCPKYMLIGTAYLPILKRLSMQWTV